MMFIMKQVGISLPSPAYCGRLFEWMTHPELRDEFLRKTIQ